MYCRCTALFLLKVAAFLILVDKEINKSLLTAFFL